MEPRPFGRGDRTLSYMVDKAIRASMEPRPFGRGDNPGMRYDVPPIVLQWSHGRSAVETRIVWLIVPEE